ncbi:hypothetical protein D1818_24895 [Aquimarina sp. BL5]|uniref:hypothetical protein n=1 Tax=Aquimarina sp. BL5 TaxID=1714860 RepID=UPI000E53A23E|nr:hypothetical protein [Aquimarina sp. BL5]AXT53894.1 hypothetical protein D1818_24895 [Aquimarina sp. BL5]RKN00855.1 hypothetical protein D7036_18300 [Aquimarina sp. BL5]
MSNPNNENTVESDVAAEWTAAWREQCPDNCKAFLIPAVDLIEVLNEMGILKDKAAAKAQKRASKNKLDVRAYMAIGSEDGGPVEERLLIVGTQEVDGVYRDVINGEIDGKSVGLGDSSNSGIYDFTLPCPNTCDNDSKLN